MAEMHTSRSAPVLVAGDQRACCAASQRSLSAIHGCRAPNTHWEASTAPRLPPLVRTPTSSTSAAGGGSTEIHAFGRRVGKGRTLRAPDRWADFCFAEEDAPGVLASVRLPTPSKTETTFSADSTTAYEWTIRGASDDASDVDASRGSAAEREVPAKTIETPTSADGSTTDYEIKSNSVCDGDSDMDSIQDFVIFSSRRSSHQMGATSSTTTTASTSALTVGGAVAATAPAAAIRRRRASTSCLVSAAPDHFGWGVTDENAPVDGLPVARLFKKRMSLPIAARVPTPHATSRRSLSLTDLPGRRGSLAPANGRGKPRGTFVIDWSVPPVERLKSKLAWRFGTLRKAFKILDQERIGALSFEQFADGLSRFGISVQEVSGHDAEAIFKEMDADSDGFLSIDEFIGGRAKEPPPDELEQWQYLTVAEKWSRWCDGTRALGAPEEKQRLASWNSRHSMAASNSEDKEEKRRKDVQRIKVMMALGVPKTEHGLRLTAPHLRDIKGTPPKDILRLEARETVDMSSKRIRHALEDCARSRRDVVSCIQALKVVEEETRLSDYRSRAAKRVAMRVHVSTVLTLDALTVLGGGDHPAES